MSRTLKKLETWKSHGLLSPQQVSAIMAYEDSLPKVRWAELGFMALGAGTVALGIISLIAYNWDSIPALIKLLGGFLILFGTGLLIPLVKHKKGWGFEGLLCFFVLFCLAMIGLIAQVYHLSGPPYQTGLFWSAITFMVATYSLHFLVPILWSSLFSLSLLTACYEWPPLSTNVSAVFTIFVLTLSILTLNLRSVLQKTLVPRVLEWIALGSWLVIVMVPSINYSYQKEKDVSLSQLIPHLVLAAAFLISLFWSRNLRPIQKRLGAAALIAVLILSATQGFMMQMQLFSQLVSLAALQILALFFFSFGNRLAFNFVILLSAGKLFEIFVANTHGLLSTGLAMIVGGLLILLAVYGWNKKRGVLETRLQEWMG